MRILHTADWHVGRTLRKRSRAEEHRAVLRQIAELARSEKVDLAIVAGDLFDTMAPAPESEEIVFEALLNLAQTGAQVIAISGNHDHPHRLNAVAPLLQRVNVYVGAVLARPERGGVISLKTRSGENATVALIPFLSQKGAVKADQIMGGEPAENVLDYQQLCRRIVAALCSELDRDSVRIAIAHLAVQGGKMGGGERAAHSVFEYYVPASIFPETLHYVALGHLHAPQKLPAGCPMWYSGAPLQLDFGEGDVPNAVLLVDAEPNSPAEVRTIELTGGRKLRQIRGTLPELRKQTGDVGDDYLKLVVRESPRIGLADELRELFPNAVDVVLEYDAVAKTDVKHSYDQMSPSELFKAYLRDENQEDEAVAAGFDALLEEMNAPA